LTKEPEVKREIKSSLFSYLFDQTKHFIDLYEECSGLRLSEEELRPFSLNSDFLARPFCNDTSQLTTDNRLLLMAEHLSSPMRNVAQRDILYYAGLIQQWLELEGKSLSRGPIFDILMPEFYVVYNGKKKFNSDYLTFGNSFLSVNAKLVDVNYENLKDKSPGNILAGYSYFIHQMEAKVAEGASRTKAFSFAVEQCIRHKFLRDIVEKEEFMVYSKAVLDFLYPTKEQLIAMELEEARLEARAEGREQGLEQGQLKSLVSQIHRKKLKGKTREQIIDELEMDESNFRLIDDFDSYTNLL